MGRFAHLRLEAVALAFLAASSATGSRLTGSTARVVLKEHRGETSTMAKVSTTRLVLGIGDDELFWAASWCNRESTRPRCTPDDFAAERSSGKETRVGAFLLDRYEVTISAYRRCVSAGACSGEPLSSLASRPDLEDHPIVMVTFDDARSYCSFRGSRLPTEAEYEAAARGPAGRRFPWGNLYHRGRVNGGSPPPRMTDDRDGFETTAPVRAFRDGSSPQGVLQLSGNVAEWTDSYFGIYGEAANMGERVVRGGHFGVPGWELRATTRVGIPPDQRRFTIGFRCARSLP